MSLRLLLLALAAGLGACAGLTSTLPERPPAPAIVGAATPAVPLLGLDATLTDLQDALERRLTERDWGVPLQLSRGAEPYIRVRLGADESFGPGSAQLRAPVLALYAEIGEVLKGAPSVVTHVLAHGDAATTAEPWTDLTARRAAAVESYLVARGVPPTRLRAEGRGAAEPATADAGAGSVNRRIELVLKPVVAGQEAEAWMPPPATAHCLPCTGDE